MRVRQSEKSSVEIAVDGILDRIRSGDFSGGHRLVEADLSSEFGVGRGPLREALRILAGDGVVELVPNKGARVRKLTQIDIVEILQVMMGLHVVAIRICAGQGSTEKARKRIREAYADLDRAAYSRDEASWFISLGRYHNVLHELSGNRLLLEEYQGLRHVHFHRELTRVLKIKRWDNYVAVYKKLTDYILLGNVQKAQALMISHVEYLVTIIMQNNEEVGIY